MLAPLRCTPVLFATVAFLSPGLAPATADAQPERWSVQGTDHYRLHYRPEHEKDAAKVEEFRAWLGGTGHKPEIMVYLYRT